MLRRSIDDLKALAVLDPEGRFAATLEQHEDLTSDELVAILRLGPRALAMFFIGAAGIIAGAMVAFALFKPVIGNAVLQSVRLLGDATVAAFFGAGKPRTLRRRVSSSPPMSRPPPRCHLPKCPVA